MNVFKLLVKLLTTPLGGGSKGISWREPIWHQIRLRKDFLCRMEIVFGSWAAASGIMWIVMASNTRRPSPALGAGFGIFGALVAVLIVYVRPGSHSGDVRVDSDGIHRKRVRPNFGYMTIEWQGTPFMAINRCVLVPAENLGKSYSVLLLSTNDGMDTFGLPKSLDIPRLERYLAKRGVTVTRGKGVPAHLTKPLPLAVGGMAILIGLVVMVAGYMVFESGQAAVGGQQPAAQQPGQDFPQGGGLPQGAGLPQGRLENRSPPNFPPAPQIPGLPRLEGLRGR